MEYLRLSDRQARHLAKLKKQSFHRYCEEHRYSPDEHEEFLLKLVKSDLRRIATAQGYDSYDQYPDDMKSVIDSTDYWAVTCDAHKRRASQIAEEIVKSQDLLPINWDYVKNLADELELKYTDKDELIRNVITGLPHIPTFEVEFNAFVGKELLVDNIPCVCVHESLPTASRSFIDVLSGGMFHFNPDRNGVELRNLSELIEISRDKKFMEVCKTCMEMIFGRSTGAVLYEKYLASLSTPELFLPVRTITTSAHYFVWLHEYGHLLMGHLLREPCHEVEYEADNFAWRVVEAKAAGNPHQGPYLRFGAFSMLNIFQLIEIVQNSIESESHPTARKRIRRLIRLVKEEDAAEIRGVISSMLTLFQATAEYHYNASYKFMRSYSGRMKKEGDQSYEALRTNIVRLAEIFEENLDKSVNDVSVLNATAQICEAIIYHSELSSIPTKIQVDVLKKCMGTFQLKFVTLGEIGDLRDLLNCAECLEETENGYLPLGFRQNMLSLLESGLLDIYYKNQERRYFDRAIQVRNEIERAASQND